MISRQSLFENSITKYVVKINSSEIHPLHTNVFSGFFRVVYIHNQCLLDRKVDYKAKLALEFYISALASLVGAYSNRT